MFEQNPAKCRYNESTQCILKKQKELRGLGDGSWSDSSDLSCVFPIVKNNDPQFCPAFTKEAGSLTKTENGIDDQWQDFNANISGQELQARGHLEKSYNQFGSKHISFCAMYGPIHYSFCVYCPSYTGKSKIGDKSKRRPGTCLNAVLSNGTSFGEMKEGKLQFFNQTIVDVTINHRRFPDFQEGNIVLVPVSETEIRSAFNMDIPKWDYLRFSRFYCQRCGPENTGRMQYHCEYCRTIDICDNCIAASKTISSNDGHQIVHFDCPQCSKPNSIDLGRGGVHATHFSKSKSNKIEHHGVTNFLPVDYGLIKRREMCPDDFPYAAIPLQNDGVERLGQISKNHGLPHPDAYPVTIDEGMSRGLYLIHDASQRAWLYSPDLDWTASLALMGPIGLTLDEFTYDAVISYTTDNLLEATRIRRSLEAQGKYVFMIESSLNKWDSLWGLRFSQAIFRARYMLFVISNTLFSSSDACQEIREFLFEEDIRNAISGENRQLVIGVGEFSPELCEKVELSFSVEEQARLFKSAIENLDGLPELLDKPTPKPFWQQIHTFEKLPCPNESVCVNCESEIYFQDEVNKEDSSKFDKLTADKWPAVACVRGHRYCLNCDARNQGGSRGSCPVCMKVKAQTAGKHPSRVHSHVAGKRPSRIVYYGNFMPEPLHGIKYNPNDFQCLNCQEKLNKDLSNSLICKDGHRFCQSCSVETLTGYENSCPECYNVSGKRISIGKSFEEEAYYYGATKDIPDQNILIVNPSGEFCWACFDNIDDEIGPRFRPRVHVCSKCLKSLGRQLNQQDYVLQSRWEHMPRDYRVGMYGERKDTPSCSACSKTMTARLPIAFEKTKTLGQNFILSICLDCFEDTLNRVDKRQIDL